MIYLIILCTFSFFITKPMELILYSQPNMLAELPEDIHKNIGKHTSIQSASRLQQTCKVLQSFYQFENCENTIENEEYNLCSELILRLAHSNNSYKEKRALFFLQSNQYERRKEALKQLYGQDIIHLIESDRLTPAEQENFFSKLKSATSYLSKTNTFFKHLEYTIKPKIDSFIIQIMCWANNNEIIDQSDNRLLHYLVASPDYLTKVKFFIDNASSEIIQKSFNLKNKFGYTPLHVICLKNNDTLLKLVIESNLINNFDITTKYGKTPLHIAYENGNKAIINLLIKSKSITKKSFNVTNKNGNNCLHLACQSNDETLVEELINTKYIEENNFNHRNKYGNTPLHIACLNNNESIVKQLIDSNYIQGETFHLNNNCGNSPLSIACSKKNKAIILLLMRAHLTFKCKTN